MRFSGRIAADVLKRIKIPDIIIGFKLSDALLAYVARLVRATRESALPASKSHVSTAPSGKLTLVRPDGTEGGQHELVEGENQIGRSLHPCSHWGATERICAIHLCASRSGAPKSSSGRVVPRPSESVVPSSRTVPAGGRA